MSRFSWGIRPPGDPTSIRPSQHPLDGRTAPSRPPRRRHNRTEAHPAHPTAPDRERAGHQAPPRSRAVARGPSWNRLRDGTRHFGTGGRGLHVTRCAERLPSTTSTCLLPPARWKDIKRKALHGRRRGVLTPVSRRGRTILRGTRTRADTISLSFTTRTTIQQT